MKTTELFTKGQQVKFAIATRVGKTRGTGVVKALPPKNASRGAVRLTVVDADKRIWKPYPSECKAA